MSSDPLIELVKALKEILKPYDQLSRPTFKGREGVEKFAQAFAKLPEEAAFASSLVSWKARCAVLLDQHTQHRTEAFAQVITDFVRNEQAKGTLVKELDTSWRVGPLEVEVNRQAARVRFRYDHETVKDWDVYLDVPKLQYAYTQARESLRQYDVDPVTARDILEGSAHWALWYQNRKLILPHLPSQDRLTIPIRELFTWMKGYLAAKPLPSKTRVKLDLPRWAFLYLIDEYRANLSSYPENERILFDTGSQRDAKTMGIILNGRKPSEDYKIFCRISVPRNVAANAL